MATKANRTHKKAKEKGKYDELHPCRNMTPPEAVRETLLHLNPADRPAFHDAKLDEDVDTCRTMHETVAQIREDLMEQAAQVGGSLDALRADDRAKAEASVNFLGVITDALLDLLPAVKDWVALQDRKLYAAKMDAASKSVSHLDDDDIELTGSKENATAAQQRMEAAQSTLVASYVDFLCATMDNMERHILARERKLPSAGYQHKKDKPAERKLNDTLALQLASEFSEHSLCEVVTVENVHGVNIETHELKCEACNSIFKQVIRSTVLDHFLARSAKDAQTDSAPNRITSCAESTQEMQSTPKIWSSPMCERRLNQSCSRHCNLRRKSAHQPQQSKSMPLVHPLRIARLSSLQPRRLL